MKIVIFIFCVLAISVATAQLVALATTSVSIIAAASTIAAGVTAGIIEKHLA